MTLHRWAEHECNGNIQREGDQGDGAPRWFSDYAIERDASPKGFRIPDRERGALKRLAAIILSRNLRRRESYAIAAANGVPATPSDVTFYHQGDPRGAALYILSPGDVPEGKDAGSYYSRGICVCGR